MQAQGTSVINTAYIDNLTDQINRIDLCAELQELTNLALQAIQAEVDSLGNQISNLLPLIVIPNSLSSVINWITHYINNILLIYTTAIATITQVIAAVARLTSAIQNAASRIQNCSISVAAIQPPSVYVTITSAPPPTA